MGDEDYRRPSLTVDAVATREAPTGKQVLLISRGNEPWKGALAFPGGFVEYGEDPEDAVLRELQEETGILGELNSIIAVKGNPSRDPRGHIVSIFYRVSVDPNSEPTAGDDAATAEWQDIAQINDEEIAGDHLDVIELLRD